MIEKYSSNLLCQEFLEKGIKLNLKMLREIARSHETAAAQIEKFAKPDNLKQEEREEVNSLLKKSSAGRFVDFNRSKSYNQEKYFCFGNAGYQAKDVNFPMRTRVFYVQ